MSLPNIWPGIVLKCPVQELERTLDIIYSVQLVKVTSYKLPNRVSNFWRIMGIDIGSDNGQSSQKNSAINVDRNTGHHEPKEKSSKGSALLMIANPVFRTEARRTAVERMTSS